MNRELIRATRSPLALVAACAIVLGAGLVIAADGNSRLGAEASLQTADGKIVGTVRFLPRGSKVAVSVRVWDISPGFHGFHVHAIGDCHHAMGFVSAGGHFNKATEYHGGHSGDLPPLLVNRDGTAQAMVVTDRFTLSDLFDADGSAVILHALRDNLGHIPARYVSTGYDAGGADPMTMATGDSGSREACGVVR
jgi:Cu-Zn family superoxide dismutase